MTDELDPEVLMIQTMMMQLQAFPDYGTRSRILAYLTARTDAGERKRNTATGIVNPALALARS